jgi:hypothetical protein
MVRNLNRALLAIATLLLAACGSGSSSIPGAGSTHGMSTAVFVIAVPGPSTSARRRPAYISPSTQSLTIAINSGTPVVVNTTPGSGNCTSAAGGGLTCTVNVNAPVGTDTFTVVLYSGTNASGTQLGSGRGTATIGSGPTNVAITLDAYVASVVITIPTPMPYQGSPSSVPVIITAKDATGATIVPPGDYIPAIQLTDSDTSGHTSLSTASVQGINSSVTLNYDGSSTITSVTISAVKSGSITSVTPAVFTPQGISNGQGGVGVITVGGTTYAEVPTAGGLLQVPIAVNGVLPSPNPSPGVTPSPSRTSNLSLSPEPDACALAPNGSSIYAYCYAFSLTPAGVINVIDLSSGTPTLVRSITTDAAALFGTSGGSCYICGISWDPTDKALLISTADGYELYDPVTGNKIGTTIPATVAENFGYNPATNQIWSPQEYGAEEDLIDVHSGLRYALTPAINANVPYPVTFPDSGAVDPTTNVAITDDEFSGNIAIVPLGGAALATPSPGASPPGSFTDANVSTAPVLADSGCGGYTANAVTIDSGTHIAFISGEFDSPDCVGAVELPSAPPASPFTPSNYKWIAALPSTPDGATFDSAGDPHVAATFYLPGNGDLYGLVFNYSRSYVAVIDITKLLAAPGSGTDPHVIDPAYDLFGNGVLTYVPTGTSIGAAERRRALHRRQLR